MRKLDLETHVRPGLTVFTKAKDLIFVFFGHLKVYLADFLTVFVRRDIETLALREVLHLFGRGVEYISREIDLNVVKVGWHLEVDRQVDVVFKLQVFKFLGDWCFVDVVFGAEGDSRVAEQVQVCLAVVDGEGRAHDDDSVLADED